MDRLSASPSNGEVVTACRLEVLGIDYNPPGTRPCPGTARSPPYVCPCPEASHEVRGKRALPAAAVGGPGGLARGERNTAAGARSTGNRFPRRVETRRCGDGRPAAVGGGGDACSPDAGLVPCLRSWTAAAVLLALINSSPEQHLRVHGEYLEDLNAAAATGRGPLHAGRLRSPCALERWAACQGEKPCQSATSIRPGDARTTWPNRSPQHEALTQPRHRSRLRISSGPGISRAGFCGWTEWSCLQRSPASSPPPRELAVVAGCARRNGGPPAPQRMRRYLGRAAAARIEYVAAAAANPTAEGLVERAKPLRRRGGAHDRTACAVAYPLRRHQRCGSTPGTAEADPRQPPHEEAPSEFHLEDHPGDSAIITLRNVMRCATPSNRRQRHPRAAG